MRLLNLMQCTNLGGMEKASVGLMQGLIEHGHSCRVLSLNPLGPLAPTLADLRIPAEGLDYRGPGGMATLPEYRRALRGLVGRCDALIMTGHNVMGMIGLGGFCRRRRVLAMHFHHEGVKSPWTWRMIYRLAAQKFTAITYPSDFVRKEAERLYPPISGITHTIRLPMALPQAPQQAEKELARRALGFPAAVPIVGNAGWLIPRKRWDVFLAVAANVHQQIPEAIFAIAGGGPLETELRQRAAELGIGDSIKWLGWIEDMPAFYTAMDVLLFNSDWDAFGLTAQEAMAYGRPVVASVANGGLKEIFEQARPGLLLDRHNTHQMAEAIVNLIRNPELRHTLGEKARSLVNEIADPENITRSYEQLLEGNSPDGKGRYP